MFYFFLLSAFDMQREREWRQKESALKVQIAQLEATLKADLGEKGSVIDRLNTEISKFRFLSVFMCASVRTEVKL